MRPMDNHSVAPLVSFVVPVANGELFIAKTLQSACAQTYPNFEIIVVDDASEDATVSVVEKHCREDARMRLVRLPERAGVAAARNAGIRSANGTFIAPLDADDIWHPDKIAYQVATMLAGGESIGMVYTWISRIDGEDNPLRGRKKHVFVEGDIVKFLLGSSFTGGGSTPLFRRKVLEFVGGYDERFFHDKIQGGEDINLYLKVASHSLVAVAPMELVRYRETSESMSSDPIVSVESSYVARKPFATLRAPRFLEKKFAGVYYFRARFYRHLAAEQRQELLRRALNLDSAVAIRGQWLRYALSTMTRAVTRQLRTWTRHMHTRKHSGAPGGIPRTLPLAISPGNRDILVSVIVPAFNMEQFICRTLESVLRQTHANIEVIVVDDCSTDRTRELTKIIARDDRRVSLQLMPENRGVCAARNRGLTVSTGQHVLFLDADDLLHPAAVTNLLACLVANEHAVMAYGGRVIVDADDEVNCHTATALSRKEVGPGCGFISRNLVGCGSGVLVSRSAAVQVGGYDETLRATYGEVCGDWVFYLKLTTVGAVAQFGGCVVAYRSSESSMSADRERLFLGYRSVYETAKALYPGKRLERRQVMAHAYFNKALDHARGRRPLRALINVVPSLWFSPKHTFKNVSAIFEKRSRVIREAVTTRYVTGLWPTKARMRRRMPLFTFFAMFHNGQPPIKYTRE